MIKSIYSIKQEYLDIISLIEEGEGELTEELEEKLSINEWELQEKSISYLEAINSGESFGLRIDEEIKRLQALKKRNINLVENLKSRILDAVVVFGEYTAGLNTFKTRKSESVEVENVNALPNEYKTVKVVETANKAAIKAALKKGEIIEGATINQKINLKIN